MRKALVTAVAIGQYNTFVVRDEMTTDLPAENLGELTSRAMLQLWRAGEDPVRCTLVITFGTVEEPSDD